MLVSIASLAPIIIVAPLADLFGPNPIIFAAGLVVGLSGLASIATGSHLSAEELLARAPSQTAGVPVDPVTGAILRRDLTRGRRRGANGGGQKGSGGQGKEPATGSGSSS